MPSRSLWRHCNGLFQFKQVKVHGSICIWTMQRNIYTSLKRWAFQRHMRDSKTCNHLFIYLFMYLLEAADWRPFVANVICFTMCPLWIKFSCSYSYSYNTIKISQGDSICIISVNKTISKQSALVQMMANMQKPLSESIMTNNLPPHICFIWPWWVNQLRYVKYV